MWLSIRISKAILAARATSSLDNTCLQQVRTGHWQLRLHGVSAHSWQLSKLATGLLEQFLAGQMQTVLVQDPLSNEWVTLVAISPSL